MNTLIPQSTEFEISREYVGRIVGSQGAAVNKLRDSLVVKIDFSDEVDEKEKEVAKKKKAAVQKAKVKVSLYLVALVNGLPNSFVHMRLRSYVCLDRWTERKCRRSQEAYSESS